MKQHPSPVPSFALASLLILPTLGVSPASAQQHNPSPSPAAPSTSQQPAAPATTQASAVQQQPGTPVDQDEGDVVRITTNLVQIDVVVTDRNGRQVSDLRPEDFEILEDNRPQKISNFSYVSSEPREATSPSPAPSVARAKNAPRPVAVPPARLRPEQVRRTIALVVDDLGTSFESTAFVRQALKKFVDEQMQPNDLVAIVRTSAGMGALQQFTTDKRQLYAAIERVRWYPSGRGGISAFAPIESDPLARAREEAEALSGNSSRREDTRTRDRTNSADDLNEFREEIFSVGTLGALNFIVKGLKELPGRKSIVMFSDGFQIFNREGQSDRILQSLRRLTDLANRASVVIYTIDARGLPVLGLTAADDTSGLSSDQIEQQISDRRTRLFETQDGMNYLAQQTGGIAIRNSNDITGGLRRVLDDQKGYYLIGYRPDEGTFNSLKGRGRFHKITPRVKRPGLRVRTRAGFYGFTEDEARRPVRRTRIEQLIGALSSPFAAGGVPLRLTSLFSSEDEKTSLVSSLLHMDARGFTFTAQPDGWHQAVIDLVALTFGDSGAVIDEVNRTETIRVRDEAHRAVLQHGLTYTLRVPVKKPGAYQLRVAVRDSGSERVGSASQFIEVPNLKKEHLALSGIVVMGSDTAAARLAAQQQQQIVANGNAAGKEEQANEPDPSGSPAVRRFRRGMSIDYFYSIYNAKLDRATRAPQLQTHVRLFREGREVFIGKPVTYDASKQADVKRLHAGSRIRLGTNLQPGEHVLQVIVTDALASEKRRTVTQWIDFEIIQ